MHRKIKGGIALVSILLIALSGCGGGGRPFSEQPPPFYQTSPPEAEAMYNQAEQGYKGGKVPQAISLWERIVQKYPYTPVAARSLNRIGEIYMAQGQYERATQYFEYLIYAYSGWNGIGAAKLNMLRLYAQTGRKKQVIKEAASIRDTSSDPSVRTALAGMMMGIYSDEGDIEAAFEWSSSGFAAANTPDQKKALTDSTIKLLNRADEGTLRKLHKKNPPEFMKAFLDFRLADIETQKGQSEMARERLMKTLAQNAGHPLAPQIQSALRGTTAATGGAAAGTQAGAAAGARAGAAAGARSDIPLNPDRVGVLVPLNGPNAKYGDMVVRGLNMAISDWNERYPDHHVTLVVKDAGTDNETAAAAFQEVTRKEGVLAIIGPLGAQSAKAVIPLANRDGVPLLTLTQREEDAEHAFVLHVFLDSRDLVRTLVKYCREKLKYERFACLFPDDRYGQRLSKIFSEVVKEQGGNVIASASYQERSTDFNEPLQKLMNIAKKNAPHFSD